ncbi:hypothetical protein [Enterococcus phage EFGrKN]|uniref:Uncharacterized protein n=1 Tax=Enterococcus phage EFGrKN TaxID=2777300 RepID=A0A7S6TZZ5_9CAUD|nr:hypothetical protein [Enterococcus phage EFGrKN]
MNRVEHAIEEIKRVLVGNKSRDVEEVYLKNAIRSLEDYRDNSQRVIAYLADKWHEDMGDVLWWEFPIRVEILVSYKTKSQPFTGSLQETVAC